MSKMGLHDPFGHLQHKLWQKERLGVKLTVWLPTTKSQELTRPLCMQVQCDTSLESSWRELQLCFRPHPNQRSEQRVIVLQSCRSPNPGSFETSGGFPQVWAMVNLMNPKSPVTCPNTKGVPNIILTKCNFEWIIKMLVTLPTPISEPQHAPLPFEVLRAGNVLRAPNISNVHYLRFFLSLSRSLEARQSNF
jgi:hypothetical protein